MILFAACASETGYKPAEFQKTIAAETRIIGKQLEVGVPVDLCQEGEFLFVLAYTPENWLHVYEKHSGEKIASLLTVGRGPGEGLNLVSMDYRMDEQNLYAYDMVLRKILVYHLDGQEGMASFVREIQLPPEGIVRKCHVLPDGNYLYEGYLSGYDIHTRLTLSDGSTVLDSYDAYPGVPEVNDQYAVLLGVSKGDPVTGRFVTGTMFGAVLECFDLSGGKIQPTGIRLLAPPEMDLSGPGMQPKQGKKYGFSAFCLTDNRIYAVYVDNVDPNEFKTIATFDWHGREKIKYLTDWNILRLCPSGRDGSLYAIASSADMEFYLAEVAL